jgi:D-alanine-D-alanine ligase
VQVLGVHDDLAPIRKASTTSSRHRLQPDRGVPRRRRLRPERGELPGAAALPYTGCNPRGLTLARDKALSKKLLAYHRIPVPEFTVVPRGAARRPEALRSRSS